MVDITKCNNTKCIMKQYCYRFMAQSGAYQSYGIFFPDYEMQHDKMIVSCEHYMRANNVK